MYPVLRALVYFHEVKKRQCPKSNTAALVIYYGAVVNDPSYTLTPYITLNPIVTLIIYSLLESTKRER